MSLMGRKYIYRNDVQLNGSKYLVPFPTFLHESQLQL